MPGTVAARCHAGIAHDPEMPPPSAPPLGPSFHTCSPGGWVDASVIVVPPTETT